MSRSPLFDQVTRSVRFALMSKQQGLSLREAVERSAERETAYEVERRDRRAFLADVGRLALSAGFAAAGSAVSATSAVAARRGSSVNVGIVGAGLAGLACADRLAAADIRATVYEASGRVGGRQWSLRGFFPGQVAERGGEFIDNLHKTMLGYAKRFRLAREDVTKIPGEVIYFLLGRHHPEFEVVEEFREFVGIMHQDLRRLSRQPTADDFNDHDLRLDNTSLLEYLNGQNAAGVAAGAIAKAAIIEAYEAEYGLDAAEQSALNFLLFIHADRRSKFTPFGIFSDERYHLVDGNDAIATHLAAGLPGPIEFGLSLTRVRRAADGRIELTLWDGAQHITRAHDIVVLTIPFSVLRHVELDASLALPPEKLFAINELGYGTNAKMMVGFSSKPWRALNGNGASYADLPDAQATWETNPTRSTDSRAILTDYSSAARGARLATPNLQMEVERFLSDLHMVFPGASAGAAGVPGARLAHLEPWPSNPLTLGSYTCYKPGQFTTIAGREGTPVGNLFFAGEHTNSFYEFQGFMEGAALSGLHAAKAVLAALSKAA
jgi:monoamine oxidase